MTTIYLIVSILICRLSFICANHSIIDTQVKILPVSAQQNQAPIPSIDDFNSSYIIYNMNSASVFTERAFALPESDCFCSYDVLINLLVCSPLFQNASSCPLTSQNQTLINVTLHDCTLFNNRLVLPSIQNKTIDYLRLYDVNRQDYLVFDSTSLSSYPINRLYIIYTYIQPLTMILMSNDTFTSSRITLSLRKLYIDTCYLITLNKPLSRLITLESLTLINIQQFSWYNIQQQIVDLPNLSSVYIEENIVSLTNNIFNVLSCQHLPSRWSLSYRLTQTCSCYFLSFLQSVRRDTNGYRCSNSTGSIDFIDDICQLNGKEYSLQNNTNFFCNQCLSKSCSNGSLCGETYDIKPTCLSLTWNDYETIRTRIPVTPLTMPYLFQESQHFLNGNPNQTLEPSAFNNVAMMLIQFNQNQSATSPSDVQMFHQTFAEMLERPWSSNLYSQTTVQSVTCQNLILSLESSIRNLNVNTTKFEFQSGPLSTISVPIQSNEVFDWIITNNNQIMSNISGANVTTRVTIKLNQTGTCQQADTTCTNRFSITALKSPKLFYDTNRIPEYDVISIIAPNRNQQVTFNFDKKISSTDSPSISTNTTTIATNSSKDSFYDQLDLMVSEGLCMYLNTTNMTWQSDGCVTNRQLSNSTSVICTCEHLTMFTVFFSLSCSTPSTALMILSWIGCILSIIGLSITLVMFIVISECHQKIKKSSQGMSLSHSSSSEELRRRIMSKPHRLSMVRSMLFVLCILLILMNIFIFILTFIKSSRDLSCSILSAILYYLTLTAFLWKFFFALQQSLFLTNICQPYWSDRTLFFLYLSLAFILPLCPLIIMFVKYPNFTFVSSTCNYCWLTREFLIYGLIIPILILVCLNFIFYLFTMVHLCLRNRQQPGLRSTKSEYSRYMQNFKIALFFAIIMGLSWIIGFLVLIPNSYLQLFGNILFCVINSFQGFAFSIMVFCMLERKSFRKCFCFWKDRKSKKLTSTSNDSNPQQIETISTDDNEVKVKASYSSSIYPSSDDLTTFKKQSLSFTNENNQPIYSTLPI